MNGEPNLSTAERGVYMLVGLGLAAAAAKPRPNPLLSVLALARRFLSGLARICGQLPGQGGSHGRPRQRTPRLSGLNGKRPQQRCGLSV